MNTREIATEYRLSQWTQVLQERRRSGLSVREYCRRSQIKECVYYYWQRKLREAACQGLTLQNGAVATSGTASGGWVTCTAQERQASGRIVIEVDVYRVAVEPDFDADTLAKVCRMLRSLC